MSSPPALASRGNGGVTYTGSGFVEIRGDPTIGALIIRILGRENGSLHLARLVGELRRGKRSRRKTRSSYYKLESENTEKESDSTKHAQATEEIWNMAKDDP